MSMTRETAAEWFETHMPTGRVKPVQKQAYLLALSALRPIRREQVEKAWKGEWETTIDAGCEVYMCSACGARDVKELYEYENPRRFCYHCGAPMTDEAVDMMMERLEMMKNGKID